MATRANQYVGEKLWGVQEGAFDDKNHRMVIVANSGGVDWMGEQLPAENADLSVIKTNPSFLWAHDDLSFPFGTIVDFRIDSTLGLVEEVEFAYDEYEFAAIGWRLYRSGHLRAASVRFLADFGDWEDYGPETPEFQKLGLLRKYLSWVQLELSGVNLPCDPLALVPALDSGDERAIVRMLGLAADLRPGMNPHPDQQPDLFAGAPHFRRSASARFRLDARMPQHEAETESAASHQKFPLADESAAWGFSAADGDALIEKGGWELFAQCHAWKDPDVDAETKAAYRLPIQKLVDGEVKTIWRGVAGAMARLLGTASIPEADRKAVYNCLAKHYAEFEKPVPELKQYGPTDAVVAAFGIDGIGALMRTLEPYIREGVELDLDADGLLEVLEGRYDDAGERKSAPDAAGDHIFGPEADEALVKQLETWKQHLTSTGKNPNASDE